MPTSHTLTGDLSDVVGTGFPRDSVWVTIKTNLGDNPVFDSAGEQIRFPRHRFALPRNAQFSKSLWSTAALTNPTGYQYGVEVEWPDGAGGAGKKRWFSGWFSLTADKDMSELDYGPMVPPEYYPELTVARDEAVAAKADAEAAQAAAEAAQAAAEAVGDTNDTIMAAVAADSGSAFASTLSASINAKADPISAQVTNLGAGLYLPTRMSGRKWRTKRARVLAGLARGHIAVVGGSIAFGAASTGTTPPKNQTSWPGRLRAILEQQGRWGGGWVMANADVFNNPTWDNRWTFGAGVTAPTGTGGTGSFGMHRSGTYVIPAGGYIEFTDTMDKVQVLHGKGASGLYTLKVDGSTVGTVGNGSGVGTIAKVTDSDATAYAPSQCVTVEVSCGAVGTHTVRIEAPAGAAVYLMGIKPIVSGNGKFEVSNASYSGKSLYSLWSASAAHNDEVNGLYGLPMIDFLKADLLVCALGINDWQFPRTLAATQTDVATLIARQTSSGNAATGAVKANGDAMLLWNPQPNTATLGLTSPQTWAQWEAGWYDSAVAANVPLLALGKRWIDYTTANAAGLLADSIHPNDTGSLDMVSAVNEAIFHGI